MLQILVADDHPIFRAGTIGILSALPEIEVVAEAQDGAAAYREILATRPQLAIVDLDMPVLSGLDVCKKVLAEKHSTGFIVLTMHKEKHFFQEAMACGVLGYLLKDDASEHLLTCIREVAAGRRFISPRIAHYLTELESTTSSPEKLKVAALLSPTEQIILKLVGGGKTSAEIAALLFVSPHTIENHRANISKKLELDGKKNALLRFAMQHFAGD